MILGVRVSNLLLHCSVDCRPIAVGLRGNQFAAATSTYCRLSGLFVLRDCRLLRVIVSFCSLRFHVFAYRTTGVRVF